MSDLVVAYCFPPYVDPSAIVAAKRVRERGRPVDVIQNAMDGFRPVDPGLESIAGDLVVRRAELTSTTHFASWSSMSQFSQLGVQQALAWDRAGPRYERVYSRAQFAASHVLAARLLLSRPDLHWTAEFSDPLSRQVDGSVRRSKAPDGALRRRLAARVRKAGFRPPEDDNAFTWVEQVSYALADELVFTNAHQLDLMMADVEDPELVARVREVAVISPHPVPPAELHSMRDPEYPLEPGVRHIGYFGRFYATRGMHTVLDALAALPIQLRENLRLHVFSGEAADLDDDIAARGLERWVRTGPYLGYLDFLALAARMDVLLVNDAVTDGTFAQNPYLPSKWSDYAGSGSRVWGLVEAGSTLEGVPLDLRSPVEHATAAARVLASIARG
ncbi:hypothetical protein [Ornithinimicrobium sp. Y1694]|uniref:hypothetical protein n=1 Tax=Ornithinimicrobium sp. Y1694 TaxID=3418590 RepID=UPI003CEB4061